MWMCSSSVRRAPLVVALAVCGLAVACSPRLVRESAQPLEGLELPLRSNAGLRAEVHGQVGGRDALVLLDVAQPITLVSTGCFGPELPKTATFVRFAEPNGDWHEAPEIDLPPARVGDRRVGSRKVALYEEDEACVLVVGTDVLSPYALEFDPERRVVRLLPSRAREAYAAEVEAAASASGEAWSEHQLLDLTRDPVTDWPLLAARLRQDGAQVTGTFVLSTGEAQTRVALQVAKTAGLEPGPDFVRELGVPDDIALPKALGGNTFALDRLELTPDFGVRFIAVEGAEPWPAEGVVGVIGGDVWGRFHSVVDPAAGVLLLRRPKIEVAGQRQRCAGPEGVSEDRCFMLHQRDAKGGLQMVATVWRELPRGARVYLDLLDAEGQELSSTCRVGLSFGRADRGVTAAHRLPWEGLERVMPECAAVLSTASAVRFALWEEEALDACPGHCAFVQDALTYRVTCDCQEGPLAGMGEAERKFIEMYRGILKKRQQEREDEPDDPE